MTPSSLVESPAQQLARSLTSIAASPGQTCHLHAVLGDYCHQSRNLLNSLKMSFYLARRCPDSQKLDPLRHLEPRYVLAERFIDRLQQIARPIPLSMVSLPLSLLIDDRVPVWTQTLARSGRALIIEPPSDSTTGAYDPMRLGQGLDDLVTWRSATAPPAHDLRLRWTIENRHFHLIWDEPKSSRSDLRPSENTLAQAAEVEHWGPLIVPLLGRLLTLQGGTLDIADSKAWTLTLRWPLDAIGHFEEAPSC